MNIMSGKVGQKTNLWTASDRDLVPTAYVLLWKVIVINVVNFRFKRVFIFSFLLLAGV